MRSLIAPIISVVLLAALPCVGTAGEGRAALQASVRIGYVDFNRALNGVSDGRLAKKKLRDEFSDKQSQLDRMQRNLTSLQEGLDRSRATVSEDELSPKREEYRDKFFELQQMLSAFRKEMETREAALTQKILKRLKDIVGEIGAAEGYALILEKSQDIVLYAPSAEDLTDKVISAYDRGYRHKGR